MLFGWIALEYERAVSSRLSLIVGPQIEPGPSPIPGDFVNEGARFSLGARYFISDEAPFGVWTGLELAPAYEQSRVEGQQYLWRTTRAISGIGTIGASTRFGLFTASAGIGAGAGFMNQNYPSNVRANYPALLTYRGFYPTVSGHLNVGMAL